ncbi:MAG: transposase [Gammaproteobacteria bacterium]|nr:transposase [Gammaproteobacteria bacterium]
MARPPRQHLPGGFYHVTLRGNHRQQIFSCGADRDALEDIVAEAASQTDAGIHAYCWMSNHLHMVVRVADAPLGRLMQRMASRYARYFQRTLGTTGHLFERRYHAGLVTTDMQLLAAVRYAHLNPVRAGLARDPARYRWSSHRWYLRQGGPAWLRTQFVLGMFDDDPHRARSRYAVFVAEDATSTATAESATAPMAPDTDAPPTPSGPPPAAVTRPEQIALEKLVQQICRQENVAEAALRSHSRDRHLVRIRIRIATEAVASGTASLSEVARRFNRHVASLSKAINRQAK